ncbi:hypothetical protein C0216_17520 [Streptomyces globosus]|uniref:DUF3592 domain-containing protein n=1 Tax=Streptomyces globosus TaxID=68209 RepID=A0A344U286_9ACTN|nr:MULTISPECIES: hypothetical protein [Streptomyces]AXE25007.1 hypothetical protein C0216_17520 [Streptomyces globosus]
MAEERRGGSARRWAGVATCAAGPAALYGWAHWCFSAEAAPSGAPALAGGAVLAAAVAVAHLVLVGGARGVFGSLLLALAMLAAVTAADRAAARPETAVCTVRAVDSTQQDSFGDGAPPPRTLHRLTLDCPGGYPDVLEDDRIAAPAGEEVRVAYDPRRRVAPEVEGMATPLVPGLWSVLLLALAVLIAASRRAAGGTGGPAGV